MAVLNKICRTNHGLVKGYEKGYQTALKKDDLDLSTTDVSFIGSCINTIICRQTLSFKALLNKQGPSFVFNYCMKGGYEAKRAHSCCDLILQCSDVTFRIELGRVSNIEVDCFIKVQLVDHSFFIDCP